MLAGPSSPHKNVDVDSVLDSPRVSALERHVGIVLEQLNDAETGLEELSVSICKVRASYNSKFEEIKILLSEIKDQVVRRPSSSNVVAVSILLQPQLQASGQPSQSGGVLTLSGKEVLSTVDVFYGGDKRSEVVDPDQFVAFTEWFDVVAWKLQAARMPSEQHVALICQKLGGAILRMFIQVQRIEGYNMLTLSLDQLRTKLINLFPEAKVKFVLVELDMRVNASKLVQSLHEFKSYILNSSMANNVDGNKYIYCKLRDKMKEAVPNILIRAATECQLQLDETVSFTAYVDKAIQIPNGMQNSYVVMYDTSYYVMGVVAYEHVHDDRVNYEDH
jgi:hypothetical protein